MDIFLTILAIISIIFNIVSAIIFFRRKSWYLTYLMIVIGAVTFYIGLLWSVPLFVLGIKQEKEYREQLRIMNQREALYIAKLTKFCHERFPAIEGKVAACTSASDAVTIVQAFALANNISLGEDLKKL